MYTTFLSLAVLAAAAVNGAVAKDLTINAPVLTQCGSAQFTWSESKGPYNLIVVPAATPCDDVLADLGDHNGLSMTWKQVNIPAGTKVLVSLEDGNEDDGWSQELTVQPSSDVSCLTDAQKAVAVANASSAIASASSSAAAAAATANNAQATGGVVNVGNNGHDVATSSAGAQPSAIGAANGGLVPVSGAATVSINSVLVLGGALLASLALF